MRSLDKHDVALLTELQRDSRQTMQQLADKIGLSSTPCWKRVKDMEANGVIRGYTALLDRDKIGLKLCVVADVHLHQHNDDAVLQFERAVLSNPAIIHCFRTMGQSDYVIHVLVRDVGAYERFVQETLFKLPGVARVHSNVVLKEVKAGSSFPIEAPVA